MGRINIGKPRKLGTTIDDLVVGQTINVTETIEDQQLLLYLGLTNDANPLYVQHDYAKKSDANAPLVPPILLMGIMTSTISKHLPGPGSELIGLDVKLEHPVYHYQTISFHFEIVEIDLGKGLVVIEISGVNEERESIVKAMATVRPPIVNKLV